MGESSRNGAGEPRSEEELTQRNVDLIGRLEQAAMDRRSLVDRGIDRITAFCGSVTFLVVHVAWYGGWIVTNLLPGFPHFDPFPFEFLTLVVSLEAIFLSTFILITQNRQAAIAERRNQLGLQINLLAEQENTKVLVLIDRIAKKLGVESGGDAETKALEQKSDPEEMVKQIEETMERVDGSKIERKAA